MAKAIKNETAYKAGPINRLVTLKVVVSLDAVPGWGDQAGDHIDLLFQNPYVQSAEIVEG